MTSLPLGDPVDPAPARKPDRVTLEGRHLCIEPLDAAKHVDSLWDALQTPGADALWTYLFDGPFATKKSLLRNLEQKAVSEDPLFFALVDRASGLARGHAAYLRIEPRHRVIEVGSILFTPVLQRTAAATEAMYLMARHAFDDLGYRRYEWKCDAFNAPSRRAAQRLGFTFEGIFRQHMIVKGRSRDTAWFAMLDSEWPGRKRAFERWLDAANFDADGRQKVALAALRGQ